MKIHNQHTAFHKHPKRALPQHWILTLRHAERLRLQRMSSLSAWNYSRGLQLYGRIYDGRQRKSRAIVNGKDVRWWTGRLRIDGRTVISTRFVHLGLVGICVGSALDERGDDGVGQNWVEPMYHAVY